MEFEENEYFDCNPGHLSPDGEGRAFQNHMLMERFSMVVEFLNQKLGEGWTNGVHLEKPQQLLEVLKDGTALCRMVGVKPEIGDGASFSNNLVNFRKACSKLGLAERSIFAVSDILSPSSLSSICVVNCLQEVRLKLVEMDRALLNELFSPTGPGSGKKSLRGSPMVTRSMVRGGATDHFNRVGSHHLEGSPIVSSSKGLLDILPTQGGGVASSSPQVQTPQHNKIVMDEYSNLYPPDTPPTPQGLQNKSSSASRSARSRRVSINTLNAQASIARVQERMATTYKDRCRQLEAGNRELLESVEDLQATIASLQRSKHEYQLDCEKLQDRNRLLLSNFRVMEAQIIACVESWQPFKGQLGHVKGLEQFENDILALHETWNDIVDEKSVKKALIAREEDANETDVESDIGDEAEKVHPQENGCSTVEEEGEEEETDQVAGENEGLDHREAVDEVISCADEEMKTKLKEEFDHQIEEMTRSKDKELAKAKEDFDAELEDLTRTKDREFSKLKNEFDVQQEELTRTKEILHQTKDHLDIREKELDQERTLRKLIESSVMEQITALKFEYADFSNDIRGTLNSSATNFNSWAKNLLQRTKSHETDHFTLQKQYQNETKKRKVLLNAVHNLRGNIRVMCRIRPVLSSDLEKEDSNVAVEPISEERLSLSTTTRSATGTEQSKISDFEFDRVFGPTSTQQSVFEEVQPLVESVMDGYHSCIFAYGQTGSGKTYTMSGDSGEHRGINYLALEELFSIYEQRRLGGMRYTIKVKNVEIYCEKVIDLLAPQDNNNISNDETAYLEIRMNERDGVHMPGCIEVPVQNAKEVEEVMALGARNRSSAHTKMNMESSRSHSVVLVSVHGENEETGRATFGQLVLVDLAGSERLSKSGVEGVQLKEAQSINKSLSCLGDVISALESKAPHVPFRNSKLTTLLQESLGKDNKALMILQVSPTTYNAQESLCSLNFAARVRNCELGKAKKKEKHGDSSRAKGLLKQAQDRVQNLEQKLSKIKGELETARQENEAVKADAEKEVEKATKKAQDKLQTISRNDQMEIKTLRDKLAARDKEDHGKVAGLEKELHEAKVEISNLRQQLRSALSSASRTSVSTSSSSTTSVASVRVASPVVSKTATTSRPQTSLRVRTTSHPRVSSQTTSSLNKSNPETTDENSSVNQKSGRNEDQTPEKLTSKKQVSWKNTPQVIPLSDRKPADYDSEVEAIGEDETVNHNNYDSEADHESDGSNPPRNKRVVSSSASSLHMRRTAASRAKTMGSAARVLQTPAKRQTAARVAARRIPSSLTTSTSSSAVPGSSAAPTSTTSSTSSRRPVWQ